MIQSTVRSTGPWTHTLDVEIPLDDVEARLDAVARNLQRRVALPGFRRGKVPLDLVRQNFADALEHEFLEHALPEWTGEAVAEAKLKPVVPPLVRNVRYTPGQPVTFEAVVEVKPEVEAKDYRGLPARRRLRPVDDAVVERTLDEVREESAVFVDLDRPAERGDVVLVDSTRLDAAGRRLAGSRAKNRRIELGAPGILPDLENGLLGAVAGQERTIEMRYPADYGVPELAGKSARYVVRVRKIQEKKLRPLDDNLARDVFQLGTLDELKARIRANLENEEKVRIQRELEAGVVEELVRRNPVELPPRLVEWMLDRVIAEATRQERVDPALRTELEGRYRPGVERSLAREVLLDAVARQEKIEATEDEAAREIDRMAQEDARHAARIRGRYQSAERREALRESLRERKAMEWLIQAADVQDENIGETPLVVPATR